LLERETMPSGTAEPECHDHPAEAFAALATAVNGADALSFNPPTARPSADGAPLAEPTRISAHATLYPSVNDKAGARVFAGSTAVI
jgi:hypothetical protein